MNDVVVFLFIALGVLVAVVYPILKGFISKEFVALGAPGLPPWVKKYAGLTVFCLLTALILLALYRSANPDTKISWWTALAMGFGFEASIEKFFAKPVGSTR